METPFTIECNYKAPMALVWKAISTKEEMKKWYFDLADFKAEVGFKFEFWAGETPEKQFHHACEITQAIPEKVLAYTWRYPGFEGNSEVIFELFQQGGGTQLKLTHKGLNTFSPDNKDFARSNFEAGWTDLLTNFLAKHLENQQ